MGAEKRKFRRDRKRAKVVIGTTSMFTVDISAGGLCVETVHVMNPGARVSGTLTYRSETFEFTGVVAWAKQGDARLGIRGRLGLQFDGISPGFYALLSQA